MDNIRGCWCGSDEDAAAIRLGRTTTMSHNAGDGCASSTSVVDTGCCFSPASRRRSAKWRRLMRAKIRRIFECPQAPAIGSHSTAAAATTTSTGAFSAATAAAYDRWSYEKNFDRGSTVWDDDEDMENLSRSFSMRFAQFPLNSSSSASVRFLMIQRHRQEQALVS